VLDRNITSVRLDGARVVRSSVQFYLAGAADGPFDLIFADPPYGLADADINAVLAELAYDGWSSPGTTIVVERAARGAPPVWPEPLDMVKQKRYGESALWYGRRR
jgi:16S rRNA (guanine966-N2)-methyltransferase